MNFQRKQTKKKVPMLTDDLLNQQTNAVTV